jgi:hypothetical protein
MRVYLCIPRQDIREEFKVNFAKGVKAYLAGEWAQARALLEAAMLVSANDGPSQTLLEFMSSSNFVKPMEWDGYRELTEK